ncbi:hypothetical protein TNCV_657301 [Trichonephila clavipes]|nr:hypothetical protein TNCV_657301 [Trichonephila clavipes]
MDVNRTATACNDACSVTTVLGYRLDMKRHTPPKILLKSNTCGLVRGYVGFEIIESSPQTTAVPGNEGGHYSAALAPPPELEVEGPD